MGLSPFIVKSGEKKKRKTNSSKLNIPTRFVFLPHQRQYKNANNNTLRSNWDIMIHAICFMLPVFRLRQKKSSTCMPFIFQHILVLFRSTKNRKNFQTFSFSAWGFSTFWVKCFAKGFLWRVQRLFGRNETKKNERGIEIVLKARLMEWKIHSRNSFNCFSFRLAFWTWKTSQDPWQLLFLLSRQALLSLRFLRSSCWKFQ